MWPFKTWGRRRAGSAARNESAWQKVISSFAFLQTLNAGERAQLRELAAGFLATKQISGAAGLEFDAGMRLTIAAQACLPVLNLGLGWYEGWEEIIVYPGDFMPEREVVDEAGVVHKVREPMQGEAWLQGPLILSWEAAQSGYQEGVNVVIHEFAHKLDMLNGEPNGFPPLHPDMNREKWARTFSAAYQDFCARVDAGEDTALDPYAAESPAEFFAVASEVFFTVPLMLKQTYPLVYGQLAAFYRQDPAARVSGG